MEKGSIRLQVLAAVSATFAYLTIGTFIGWPSSTCPLLTGQNSPLPISSEQCSWVVAISNFGMLCAPIPTGYLSDLLGRKVVMATATVPFIVSWLMVTLARSVEELYIARFMAGLGQGIAFSVGPIYLAEISEDRIRGAMGTLFQIMLNIGTLYEYCVGPYVPYATLAISSAVFPFLFLITFVWMPESPYYLLDKERQKDAEESLMKLRGVKEKVSVKEELEMMQLTLDIQKKEKGSPLDLIRHRGNRKAFLIVIGLIFCQAFSGIIAILSYTASIFKSSGSEIDANMSAIIVGIVTLLTSVASSLLVDRAGRRPLLLLSSAGCSLCMIGLGIYFLYAPVIDKSINIDWIPLALMIIYIMMFMAGLGPLPWAVAGEILPSNIKGYAIAMASMTSPALTLIVVKMFQLLTDGAGTYVVFWIFGVCCGVSTVGISLFVPETKGKSLLEIYEELNKTPDQRSTVCSISTIATTLSSDLEMNKKCFHSSDPHKLVST
ncbi:facilitated trehalose transporter Tret1-like [Anabrus simplex]|uniref:facilitated trehalose transporter Tret1-like n=1 Tax=Anabrus simplex TaxID=316456 RepID=UPI0035A271D7